VVPARRDKNHMIVALTHKWLLALWHCVTTAGGTRRRRPASGDGLNAYVGLASQRLMGLPLRAELAGPVIRTRGMPSSR
jgi:hypothetical protein